MDRRGWGRDGLYDATTGVGLQPHDLLPLWSYRAAYQRVDGGIDREEYGAVELFRLWAHQSECYTDQFRIEFRSRLMDAAALCGSRLTTSGMRKPRRQSLLITPR